MKKNKKTDPIEIIIKKALDRAGVKYKSDDPLDFECDGFAIEVKQFYTPRIMKQIAFRENVILIQGKKAAEAFATMLTRRIRDVPES